MGKPDWIRDTSSNYPRIYKEFLGKSGKIYWIQDLTDDYIEEVVEKYSKYFLREEPIGKFAECTNDTVCINEVVMGFREKLQQLLSLICLTKDDNGEIRIAGYNSLYIMKKDVEMEECKSPITYRFMKLIHYIFNQKDPYTEFGADKFIGAMGLYVMPQYRGDGLGKEILQARKLIALEQGFKGSLTLFTSIISQHLAEQVGFKDYVVSSYEDLGNIDEDFKFPGIEKHTKLCKYMYIMY